MRHSSKKMNWKDWLMKLFVNLIPSRSLRRKFRTFIQQRRIRRDFFQGIHLFSSVPATFAFPEVEQPLVSIFIPVFNQYSCTCKCLWSILQNTGSEIPFEILLGDDASTDETRSIPERISGIRYLRSEENQGFLWNCNHGIAQARGKYVLLLNNDTQVQPNWLSSLVELLERDEAIGLTGSMMLYPDLHLQEAGGIIWKDASAGRYGCRQAPWNSRFQYVKDVDYISGASILFRKSLWDELGGFDETFAPAYYEDTDFEFRIREQKGLRIVYQPASVVVHFDGTSYGKKAKRCREDLLNANAKKFWNRWQKVLLKKQCTPNELFLARDRGQDRPLLLFVEDRIPSFDWNAGSRASFQYMQYFLRRGFQVKLLVQDASVPEMKYLERISQMGIEVLPWSALWAYGRYVSVIYLNRPDVAGAFLKGLRKFSNAPVLYQGHDLHFLRLRRQYEKTGKSAQLLKKCEKMRKMELNIFQNSDCVFYFSDEEVRRVHEMCPSVMAETIPLYILNVGSMELLEYRANSRKDILFVGGFGHLPNGDAVKWFASEIFPKVLKKIPDLCWHIVGSRTPPEVWALDGPNIRVHGFLSDEELDALYAKIRLTVVPLRYGAGVKGKIIDSLYRKVPVLTTAIGAEGIFNTDDVLAVADDADSFAEELVRLYSDETVLEGMAGRCASFVERCFSDQAVTEKFRSCFERLQSESVQLF